MRRTSLLIILAIMALLAGGYTLWQRELFYRKVKEGIVESLASRLGVEMVVASVEGGLWNDILLDDVCIKNLDRSGEEMTVSQVLLKYNLWKMIIQQKSSSIIQRIELVQPYLRLSRDREGRWNWAEQISNFLKREEDHCLPQIVIRKGRLVFSDDLTGNRLQFNRVDGLIRSNSAILRFREGQIDLVGRDEPLTGVKLSLSLDRERLLIKDLTLGYRQIKLSLQGEIPNIRERRMTLEGVINTFNLKEISNLFSQGIRDRLSKIDLRGQFKFKGELEYSIENGFLLSGEIRFTGQPLSMSARVSYQEEKLTLSPLRVEGLELQGNIDLKDALVDLKLSASRLDLGRLTLFVDQDMELPFLMDGRVKIFGPIEDPWIKGVVRFVPNNPKSETRLDIAFLKEKEVLQIESFRFNHRNGGRLLLKGVSRKDKRGFSNLNIEGSLYLPYTNHYLSSRVKFNGRARDILSDPHFVGELRLLGLSIDKERLGDSIHQIEYKRKILNVSTPSPDSSAHLSGWIGLSPLKLNLQVRPDNLDLKPLLVLCGLKGVEAKVLGVITVKTEKDQKLLFFGQQLRIRGILPGSSGFLSFISKGGRIDILGLEFRQEDGGSLNTIGRLYLAEKSLQLMTNCQTFRIGKSIIDGRFKTEGRMDDFKVNGSFEMETAGASIDIEDIQARLGFSEGRMIIHSLNARLGRAGRLSAQGVYPLNGKDSKLNLRLQDFDWQEIPWARDYFKDWQGKIDLSARLRSDLDSPNLLVSLGPIPVKIKDEELKEFKGEFFYQRGQLKLRLEPTSNLLINGEIIPANSKLDLKAEIRQEKLSLLAKFLPFFLDGVEARVHGIVTIKEDWKNPLVRGNLSLDPIAGSLLETVQIKTKFLIKDKIFMTEAFHIQQPTGHLSLSKCQIGPLPSGRVKISAELVDFKLPGPRLTGRLDFDGWLKSGSTLLEGEIRSSSLWLNRKFEIKDLAVKFLYQNGKGLKFVPLEAGVSLSGMVGVSEGKMEISAVKILQKKKDMVCCKGLLNLEKKKIDLEMLVADVDLGLLFQHLEVIKEVEGWGNGRFRLKGPFDNTQLEGVMNAKAKRLEVLYLVDKVRDLETKIVIHNNLVAIERLNAKAGGSKLKVTSKKISPEEMDFQIELEGRPLRVNIPEFLQGEIEPDLHLTGSFNDPKCSGQIQLSNTRFTYPLAQDKVSLVNRFFEIIDWDLKMIARKNVKYYNNFVDVELKDGSWISVKGRGKDRRIGGLVWARPKKGKVIFLGTEFILQEAELKFEEDKKAPFIFGTAKAVVDQEEIYLIHNGRLFEAEPILTTPGSHPPKTTEEILGILHFGRNYTSLSREDSRTLLWIGMLRLANARFSSSLIYPLERRLSSLFNIDIGIKTDLIEKTLANTSQSPLSETELNLGKYITEDLYLKYQTKILGPDVDHRFGLEYQLPDEEAIQYEYIPGRELQEQEHKVIFKKEIPLP